jgi:pimeloyl-ACP methyl ester carboxylesterase
MVEAKRVEFEGTGVPLVGDLWTADGGQHDPRGVVLLLHGGGQTRHSWYRTGQRLGAAGWTALAYDARGHGDSEWATDGDYGLDALVGDLRAVVAGVRGQIADVAPVLVGASMGGGTSMVAEGEHPGLAAALVLVDIVPRIDPVGVKRITDFMASNPEGFADLDEVAEVIAAYNPHRKRAPSVEGLRKNVRLRADGRWYWHWDPAFLSIRDEPSRAVRTDRITDAAGNVRVPTMLVRGRHSDIVNDQGVAELLELIPGARYVDVADAGHMVAGDDNDVFTENLTGFLDEVAGTGTPRLDHPSAG